jgi:SAM-dependent methyltransferase
METKNQEGDEVPRVNSQLSPAVRSFRDPSGCLFSINGQTVRIVKPEAVPVLTEFLLTDTWTRFGGEGRLISTRKIQPSEIPWLLSECRLEESGLVVEHDTVPFQSYPFEWPFEMLRAAALLTLDLAASSLADGFGLKDATPYNILFKGSKPVFVDILSFEKRNPRDPIWLADGQFNRTFTLPLLVSSYCDVPLAMLLSYRRDGLYPQEAYSFLGILRRIKPSAFFAVTLPVWLASRGNTDGLGRYERRLVGSPEKASFILDSLFRRKRQTIARLRTPKGRGLPWLSYESSRSHYSDRQLEEKFSFVDEALAKTKPKRVLDVGCNAGQYSILAAQYGASVVAIDSNSQVVGRLWSRVSAGSLDILPLVVNLAQPSPSSGWRNKEWASFLDRAKGYFDAVFMLAVIHHMLVTERIPLHEILQLVADLTREIAVVEFISPEDPMFQHLSRTNQRLYLDITKDVFEVECKKFFRIERCLQLSSSHRWLYLLSKGSYSVLS